MGSGYFPRANSSQITSPSGSFHKSPTLISAALDHFSRPRCHSNPPVKEIDRTTSSAYIFLSAGWQQNTQSSSVLDRSQASRCGEWRTSTWCRFPRTCTGDFTPVTPTSSSTPSNSAPETCSTTSTSGWVSAERDVQGKTLHLKDDEAL